MILTGIEAYVGSRGWVASSCARHQVQNGSEGRQPSRMDGTWHAAEVSPGQGSHDAAAEQAHGTSDLGSPRPADLPDKH